MAEKKRGWRVNRDEYEIELTDPYYTPAKWIQRITDLANWLLIIGSVIAVFLPVSVQFPLLALAFALMLRLTIRKLTIVELGSIAARCPAGDVKIQLGGSSVR